MRIGIRLHDSADGTYEQRLHAVREQGFSCIHLALSKIPDLAALTKDPSASMAPATLTPGYAMYLKHCLDAENLDMAVLGCYKNLADPEDLKAAQAMYTAHLRFGSWCGAGVVGTETPCRAMSEEQRCSDQALEQLARHLEPVVRSAENFGMVLALEPVYRHVMHSPARARRLLDMIGSPNLQIILDPVNLIDPAKASLGKTEASSEEPAAPDGGSAGLPVHQADAVDCSYIDELMAEAVELLGADTAVIHLKDFILRDGKMEAVACGLGQMSCRSESTGATAYDRIIRYAAECKPHIHATLENTKPDNAISARRFVEELQAEIE